MATKHKVTATLPTSGAVQPGLVITLKWGSDCINGRTPGGTVGTYTEAPASSGAYEVTITETNSYTVEVNGTVQSELQDVWLVAGDIITAPTLASTSSGKGASLIGIYDSAGRYTATTVEAALAEIAGASRTTETVKSAYDLANAQATILSGISNAMLIDLTDGGASTAHTHDARYFTETELSSTGVSALRVADNGTIKTVGGTTGALTIGSAGDTSGDMGTLTLDAHTVAASRNGGKVLVDLRAGSGGVAGTFKVNYDGTEYDVITEWEVGDLNLSNATYLSTLDIADEGFITRCLRELDSRVAFAINQLTGGNTRFWIAYAPQKQQTLGSIAGAGAVAWGSWTNTTTYKEAARVTLPHTELGISRVRIYYYALHSTGSGGGLIRASIGGPLNTVSANVTNTSGEWAYIEFLYDENFASPQDLLLEIGTTSGTITLYENFVVVYL